MWRLLCMFLPPIKTLCSIGNEFFCVATVRKLVGGKKHWLQTDTFVWRWRLKRSAGAGTPKETGKARSSWIAEMFWFPPVVKKTLRRDASLEPFPPPLLLFSVAWQDLSNSIELGQDRSAQNRETVGQDLLRISLWSFCLLLHPLRLEILLYNNAILISLEQLIAACSSL
jgi:hypothetical protein